MAKGRSIVGIDLGTTNTVVARATRDHGADVVPLSQLTGPSLVLARPLLPSVLYAPFESEGVRDPYEESPFIVGQWAETRSREVPGRGVVSAKSWLCHSAVDREAPILPWGARDDDEKLARISPVAASARILRHVRNAYNAAYPDEPLEEQDITLTIPASFDVTARALTVRAASLAGLSVRLLEEPQAAFYDYLAQGSLGQSGLWERVRDTPLTALVCDIGGGTTDLSLIRIKRSGEPGRVEAERIAVGRHLLLGGDNMDLAIAHAIEPGVRGSADSLAAAEYEQLVAACRGAKEALLATDAKETHAIRLVARGSALVGGVRTFDVSRDLVQRVVLDGFFPFVAREGTALPRRSALVSSGLPYERDVAITRHVNQFLSRHLGGGAGDVSLLLLNGGVTKAPQIAERLEEAVSAWVGRKVTRLANPNHDSAVARGAVAYGLSLGGHGVRIGGGSSRGFYIGIEGERDGVPLGVCVVPRGAVEGEPQKQGDKTFKLRMGRLVRFDLYASDRANTDSIGDVVALHGTEFERLPPLVTRLTGGPDDQELLVHMEGELSAVGTLDLACVEVPPPGEEPRESTPRRFRLEFQITPDDTEPRPSAGQRLRAPEPAQRLIERAFGKARSDATGREAKDLVRDLEQVLGERSSWDVVTLRALFDVLVAVDRGRRRSLDHERVFFLLAGYLARPGFGCLGDVERVAALARLFDAKLAFPGEPRGWTQFWIAWRRVAPGLDEATQTRMRDTIDPWLDPAGASGKKAKKGSIGTFAELLDIAGHLERIAPSRRSELGSWILEKTWTSRDPLLWTLLGRVGARVPFYASAHHVVPAHVAERWIDHALRENWGALPAAANACALLARATGDRARDVSPTVQREVARKLIASSADPSIVKMVTEVVPLRSRERELVLGEDLPAGLRLHDEIIPTAPGAPRG